MSGQTDWSLAPHWAISAVGAFWTVGRSAILVFTLARFAAGRPSRRRNACRAYQQAAAGPAPRPARTEFAGVADERQTLEVDTSIGAMAPRYGLASAARRSSRRSRWSRCCSTCAAPGEASQPTDLRDSVALRASDPIYSFVPNALASSSRTLSSEVTFPWCKLYGQSRYQPAVLHSVAGIVLIQGGWSWPRLSPRLRQPQGFSACQRALRLRVVS